jgi:N-acyl-D-aspartate/D-glutamate deacylase
MRKPKYDDVQEEAMAYDLLIKGGVIVDGTRTARFVADVAIRNGVIERIGRDLPAVGATKVIDAAGRIVAPGVIDPHTHYDAQVHWDPYCTNSGWHGNTTVVVGNCGFGFMPCHARDRDRYMLMMENTEQVPLAAMRQALPWTWETFPEWMEHMRALAKGVNLAAYMPLNSLMIYVMGYDAAKSRGATPEERAIMRDLLHEAMDAGAIGFGFSYLNEHNTHKDTDGTPMPTDAMCVDDAVFLAGVLRERGEGLIQCLCELPPGKVANRDVVERLAEASGRPILLNIVTPVDTMPEYHRSLLDWLDQMEAKGLNIYGQAFVNRSWNQLTAKEYDQWSTTSESFAEFTAAPVDAKVRLAADPAFRARAAAQYNPAVWAGAGGPLESFRLVDAHGAEGYAKYHGALLGEMAADLGVPATEVFFDLVARSDCKAELRTTLATSDDPLKSAEILMHKRVLSGTSDGGAHVKFHSGGQYATDNIIWLSREKELISLEDMHFKLSYLPARVIGLARRGALIEGYAADLFIYDYAALGYDRDQYQTVNDLPLGDWRRVARAQGVDWVIVNGVPIFQGGECTGATPGRMLSAGGVEKDRAIGNVPALAAE